MTAFLPLTAYGRVVGSVLVDDDTADHLAPYLARGWRIRRGTQGNRRPMLVSTERGRVPSQWTRGGMPLARLITKAPPGLYPRHLNGDVMDCRRENLELTVSRGEAGYAAKQDCLS